MLSTLVLAAAFTVATLNQGSGAEDVRTSFLNAAREANRNPYDYEAQIHAARHGFAVTLVPAADKDGFAALSLLRLARRAVELRPQAAEGYLWEGIGIALAATVFGKAGDESVANGYLTAMRQSLKLDPDCLGGLATAHMAYMHAGTLMGSKPANRESARKFVAEVLQRAHKSPAALYYAAQIATLSGDIKRANRALAALYAFERGSTFDALVAGTIRRVGTSSQAFTSRPD